MSGLIGPNENIVPADSDNFVYVLGCVRDGRYATYVGWTNNVAKRLAKHNAGTGARSTRGRVWTLIYSEQHASRSDAMSREWHLKRDRTMRKRLAQECLGI